MGNINRIREVLLYNSEERKVFTEIFTGEEVYKKLPWGKHKYGVKASSDFLIKVEALLDDALKNSFFYFNPENKYEIILCDFYDDFYYKNSKDGVSRKTDKLVDKCIKLLGRNGVSDESLVVFIKKEDNKFHLEIDFEDCGFLDDDLNDLEFKKMITSVLKDVKTDCNVIVLPSQGKDFFFRKTVAVYKTKSVFDECLVRRSRDSNSFNIVEKEIALDVSNSLV